ncbi:hypothetical protein NDU88_001857 [Pleurodeles waltl]|uniref:Uncharacterized protein n=1 Tax=Pleurodeles waltl TaxID=8319 RepID=A0AAV7KUH6_PLEWA|nr:hypothetical protein NDU88_001857 [Pleurodeles waltl]
MLNTNDIKQHLPKLSMYPPLAFAGLLCPSPRLILWRWSTDPRPHQEQAPMLCTAAAPLLHQSSFALTAKGRRGSINGLGARATSCDLASFRLLVAQFISPASHPQHLSLWGLGSRTKAGRRGHAYDAVEPGAGDGQDTGARAQQQQRVNTSHMYW